MNVTEDHLHKFKVELIAGKEVEIRLEVGYEAVLIEKMFGPLIFCDLRLRADPSTCEWVIERQCGFTQDEQGDGPAIWREWVRIPGQLTEDFSGHPELQTEVEAK